MLRTGRPLRRKMLPMGEGIAITGLSEPIDLRAAKLANSDVARTMDRLVVLLLEDEPLISMDLETTLVDADIEVHCAMSCEQAHAWLETHTPDVVIVDIVLRDGRCTEVVSRLLQAGIPFIVHSGSHRSDHLGTPFDLGAWLPKPSAPNALVQAVSAAAAHS
jgi:DNA-binding response OmpR family regulator